MRAFLVLTVACGVVATGGAQSLPVLPNTVVTSAQAAPGHVLGYCAALADVPAAEGLPPSGPLAFSAAPGAPASGYFFRREGQAWAQVHRVVPDATGYFGRACSLTPDGILVAVGAPYRTEPPATGQYTGGVVLFRYQPVANSWTQEAVLRSTPLNVSTFFGQSVAVARDGVGAEATTERVLALGGGRAWVQHRAAHPDSVWTEEARLEPDPGDSFQGMTADAARPHHRASLVAGSDGAWRAVAGGPYSSDDGTTYTGAAYLWRYDPDAPGTPPAAGGWVREARVVGTAGACLGHSVALAEAGGVWLAAVGATQACVGGGVGTGYVVVLRLDGETWVEEARLTRPESGLRDFGDSVALTVSPGGGAVLVATTFLREGTSAPPIAAYAFERTPSAGGGGSWRAAARLDTTTPTSATGGAWSVAVAGRTAIVGDPEEDTAGMDAGALLAFDLSGVLTPSEPLPTTEQLSVAAWPNPSSGTSSVRFTMPESGAVTVTVYDVLGREVATLFDGPLGAGRHRLSLPSSLGPGVYAVRVSAGEVSATARWVVAR